MKRNCLGAKLKFDYLSWANQGLFCKAFYINLSYCIAYSSISLNLAVIVVIAGGLLVFGKGG